MSQQIVRDRNVEALKEAASWPGADRATLVTLATVLAATGADQDGADYFGALAAAQPDQVLPLALAGYFEVRAGQDTEAGIAKLDEAASRDLGPAQYYRGLALAGLPAAHGRADQAVADLEFVLAVRDQFPSAMIRAVYHGLASAYAAAGKEELAARAAEASGLSSAPEQTRLQFTGGWMSAAEGFHMAAPRITEVAPGVQVAQAYDFGDFAFVRTEAGVVAIDAGTAPHRVRAALADAGIDAGDISHVILTHAHFDHAGGISALTGPATKVIAQAGFPAELQRQHGNVFPFRYFTGDGAGFGGGDQPDVRPAEITADQLIAERTRLSIGGTEFVLYPTSGGETGDALMVYLPATGVLFTGDVMMPYLGAPFFAEGSPEGLLDVLALIAEMRPRQLVHGHILLTELFTAETVPGLLPALTELRDESLTRIRREQTLTDVLAANVLPETLREHPAAVGPFVVVREHFVQRLYQQHAGYWQPDGSGLEPVSAAERAAALDLLADGRPERFAAAARALLAQRDPALALEIATAGLTRHPQNADLAQLRLSALYRLMERHQLQDPFRFLIYAELAGVEIGPVAEA
ncbi:MAG TPA: MBL fold metallo-hydrolase [Streptosporangiaceae bacterium]|jgi:glyoxylase-like metal-dependent hydrolase (beta-lactamase superfamily II)